MLSLSVAQFFAYMIDHTVAQVCALSVSSSSPCLMRRLSDSLFDFSIYFIFLLFIIFSFQHFLLLFTFLEVSRQQPRALPLISWVPCRRRADHSEGEGLSTCLSSSSMSHDRTGKAVVCRDASHSQGHEIQRQNSENEQIRTFLDRQSEQILADCQAEIRKHELQPDYDRRSI